MDFELDQDTSLSMMNESKLFMLTTKDENTSLNLEDNISVSIIWNQGEPIVEILSRETLDKVTFIFTFVLIPVLAVFGAIGNVLSLVVLVQHRMRSATNLCLAGLAVSDLFLLLHSLTFSAYQIHGLRDPEGAQWIRTITYPVLAAYGSIVCARITTWLTTMLGVERCIAVYFPMKAKAINSWFGTLVLIIAIYIVTALAFLPTALQYKVEYVPGSNNKTLTVNITFSTLGLNKTFMNAYSNMLNVLFRILPLVILIVVNTLIIAAIRRTGILRQHMSSNRNRAAGYEQSRITMMLLTVTGVFLLCTLPGAINTMLTRSVPGYSRLGHQTNLYQAVSTVTYFLETLNSSVNFIIYMAFSTKFCRTYKEIFCCLSPTLRRVSLIRSVRFTPRVPINTSLTTAHELHCLQLRLSAPITYPSAGRNESFSPRFKANGYGRSSFDVDDVHLLNNRYMASQISLPNSSQGSARDSCCTCKLGKQSWSQSRSSQSRSHSSESTANQYN